MAQAIPPRATVIKHARRDASDRTPQPLFRHADFESMARWRAFVEVLDELLINRSSASPVTTQGRPYAPPLYAYTPHLNPNRFWSTPGPYHPATRGAAPVVGMPADEDTWLRDAASESMASSRGDEPRAARRLRPAEESALQTLVRLGAALDSSFTARELRSAFRTLAQRYHPDRHPNVSDAERMRLGATFAELTSAYGVLQSTN